MVSRSDDYPWTTELIKELQKHCHHSFELSMLSLVCALLPQRVELVKEEYPVLATAEVEDGGHVPCRLAQK